MAQAAEKVLEFPSGGIADFYMEDHEIEALEREEAEQEFGSAGIATFEPIAHRMASYGRHGDDTVAHVETGELVIPKALIEDNPRLRASIFSHLEELGVEDPERYVVGSGANSINPDTGLPEFFFKKIRKAVSKIGRGVKKAVKSVAKVIKKAAPIILPAIGTFFMGPIYGAALGSGIATLIQGGNLKDAFKSALISGGTGALLSGVTGGFKAMGQPGGGFMKGFGDSVRTAANTSNISTGLSNIGKAVTGDFSGLSLGNAAGGPTAEGGTNPIKAETATATDVTSTTQLPPDVVKEPPKNLFGKPLKVAYDPSAGTDSLAAIQDRVGDLGQNLSGPAPTAGPATFSNIPETPTFFESLQDAYTPGGRGPLESLGDAFLPSGPTAQEILTANNLPATAENLKVAGELAKEAAPSFTRAVLPGATVATVGAGIGLNKMMGDGDDPDDPTTEDLQEQLGPTGGDLIAQYPEKYLVTGNTEVPVGATGEFAVPTDYAYLGQDYYNQNPFLRARGIGGTPFVQQAAEGGQIFPRRVGGIMPNEGVPGQDSVRAMLMPGEFVMTTDAVRGLGNGNNEQGINRMYDMMRGLEAKGKAMA